MPKKSGKIEKMPKVPKISNEPRPFLKSQVKEGTPSNEERTPANGWLVW
jgi:hypothetical protein